MPLKMPFCFWFWRGRSGGSRRRARRRGGYWSCCSRGSRGRLFRGSGGRGCGRRGLWRGRLGRRLNEAKWPKRSEGKYFILILILWTWTRFDVSKTCQNMFRFSVNMLVGKKGAGRTITITITIEMKIISFPHFFSSLLFSSCTPPKTKKLKTSKTKKNSPKLLINLSHLSCSCLCLCCQRPCRFPCRLRSSP